MRPLLPELLQGVAAKLEAVPPVEKLLLLVADARVEPWKLLAVGGVVQHLLLRGEPEELLRAAHHLAHHLPRHAMVDHLHVTQGFRLSANEHVMLSRQARMSETERFAMVFFGSVVHVQEEFKIYYCQLICHIKLHDNELLGKCRIFPSDQTVVETERQLKKDEIQSGGARSKN